MIAGLGKCRDGMKFRSTGRCALWLSDFLTHRWGIVSLGRWKHGISRYVTYEDMSKGA